MRKEASIEQWRTLYKAAINMFEMLEPDEEAVHLRGLKSFMEEMQRFAI